MLYVGVSGVKCIPRFVIPGRKYAYRTWFNFEGRKSGRDYIIEALEREENPWVIASEEALERVLQILNARGAVLDPKETKGSPHQDGRLLNALFDDTTCDGTNTLAILLAFDLGEANGQALLHELRVRETHTWPSSSELEQYQFGPPSMLGGQYPPELLLPADQIKQRYRAALDLMQSGKLPLLDSKVVDLPLPSSTRGGNSAKPPREAAGWKGCSRNSPPTKVP